MKFTSVVNSFKAGKVSKKISKRQDIETIKDGCEELENFILYPNGVLKRRFGIGSINTLSSIGNGEIYALNYSKEHSYIVFLKEGTQQNIFATESRLINDPRLGVSNQTTCEFVRIFDSLGTEYKVETLLQKAKFYIDSTHTMFTKSSESPYRGLPHDGWNVTQFSRKLIFVHNSGNYPPFIVDLILSEGSNPRFNVVPWSLDLDLFTRNSSIESLGGDYAALGGTTMPMAPMGKQYYQITVDNPNGVAVDGKIIEAIDLKSIKRIGIPVAFFDTGDYNAMIGACIKTLRGTSVEGIYFITGRVAGPISGTVNYYAVASIEGDNDATTNTYDFWTLSYWGYKNGYPKTVSSFRGRLVFGGTKTAANRFFMTAANANNVASFQNLQPSKLIQDASTTDFSGLAFYNSAITSDLGITAAFNESNSGDIAWIKGRRILHFGTTTGEFQVSFINNTVALSNMEVQKVSSYSSTNVNPVEGDQKIIYIANGGSVIRTVSTNARDYESTDIAVSAMFTELSNIKKLGWVERASSLLFLSNSTLKAVCINEQTQVVGFYDLSFGNDVKSFIVSQNKIDGIDTDIVVGLMTDGTNYKLHYNLVDHVDKDSYQSSYFYFLDYCVSGVLANPTNIFWADKEVVVYWTALKTTEILQADSLGQILLSNPDNEIYVAGLRFKSRLTTVPINYASRFGQAVGLIKRVDRAEVGVTKSGRFYIGTNTGELFIAPKSDVTNTYEDYNPIIELSNSPDYDVKCIIESYEEEPLNINTIAYRGVTYEGE